MRQWKDLNQSERVSATGKRIEELLDLLASGVDITKDDAFIKRVDARQQQADLNETPWFFTEYLRDDSIIMKTVNQIAVKDCKTYYYDIVKDDRRIVTWRL